jgi:hypothetical protein
MILSSGFSEHPAGLSPDGRWVVFGSNETGRREVYVQPVQKSGAKRQVSTNGGAQPLWSRDGGEIFYRDGDRMIAVAVKTESDRVRLDPPVVLFEGEFARGTFRFTAYDATRDGDRFLMLQPVAGGRVTQEIIVVLNWHEELKRLVPTDH